MKRRSGNICRRRGGGNVPQDRRRFRLSVLEPLEPRRLLASLLSETTSLPALLDGTADYRPLAEVRGATDPKVEGTPITVTGMAGYPPGVSRVLSYQWSVYRADHLFASQEGKALFVESDLDLWMQNRFQYGTDWKHADFNGDGKTDVSDLNVWNKYRWTSPSDWPVEFSFTPDDNGNYWVALTVNDDQGGSTSAEQTIDVANAPPTAQITATSDPKLEGTPITVTGAASDPAGANDTLTYRWTVYQGDSVFATGQGEGLTEFTFTPDDGGTYRIVLGVSDEDGGSATDERTIDVQSAPPTSAINTQAVEALWAAGGVPGSQGPMAPPVLTAGPGAQAAAAPGAVAPTVATGGGPLGISSVTLRGAGGQVVRMAWANMPLPSLSRDIVEGIFQEPEQLLLVLAESTVPVVQATEAGEPAPPKPPADPPPAVPAVLAKPVPPEAEADQGWLAAGQGYWWVLAVSASALTASASWWYRRHLQGTVSSGRRRHGLYHLLKKTIGLGYHSR